MMDARGFYAVGRSYLHAAQITAAHPRAGDEYLARPIHTLIGFSLELFMKAVLAYGSYHPDVQSKKVGHGLRKRFATCRAERYSGGVAGLVEQVVGHMHDHHLGYTFRYSPPGAAFVVPDAQQSLSVLVGFDSEVAGATDDEIKEAVAVAGTVRFWSTMLNGAAYDMQAFRHEIGAATSSASATPR